MELSQPRALPRKNAQGWEAHLADLDDDGQDEVVFYCPVCAEREFHAAE